MASFATFRGARASSLGALLTSIFTAFVLLGSFAEVLVQAQSEAPRVTLSNPDEPLASSSGSGSGSSSITSTVAAPDAPAKSDSSSSVDTPTTSVTTTVVSIFYLNIRGDEERGLPYTMYHRDTGSVVDVDGTATTFVVTGTITDLRTGTFVPSSELSTISRRTIRGGVSANIFRGNKTAAPSTITQGPGTFIFTGTNYGPERTLVNQCKLDGTTSASCSLTHIGKGWYTRKSPDFSGAWSTYNYTWTNGDRFGFAPVTITGGLEKLPGPSAGASTSSGAGGMPTAVMLDEAYRLARTAAAFGLLIVGIFAIL